MQKYMSVISESGPENFELIIHQSLFPPLVGSQIGQPSMFDVTNDHNASVVEKESISLKDPVEQHFHSHLQWKDCNMSLN